MPASERRHRAAIARGKHGFAALEPRRMGVVAIDAMIAQARPESRRPRALHSTVRAARVVTALRSVALATQAHRIDHRELLAVREVQRIVAPRALDVAMRTAELAVPEGKALVEVAELLGVARKRLDRL